MPLSVGVLEEEEEEDEEEEEEERGVLDPRVCRLRPFRFLRIPRRG
jgi:hypothetical protein